MESSGIGGLLSAYLNLVDSISQTLKSNAPLCLQFYLPFRPIATKAESAGAVKVDSSAKGEGAEAKADTLKIRTASKSDGVEANSRRNHLIFIVGFVLLAGIGVKLSNRKNHEHNK